MANEIGVEVLSTQGVVKPPVKKTNVMFVLMLIKRNDTEPLQVSSKQIPPNLFWHVGLPQSMYCGSECRNLYYRHHAPKFNEAQEPSIGSIFVFYQYFLESTSEISGIGIQLSLVRVILIGTNY